MSAASTAAHAAQGTFAPPRCRRSRSRRASPAGLLACIATAKYADALPLYRQCQQLQRIGVELSRTTLATWMVRVGELVVPLINVLRDELVGAIHEEHVPVDVKVQRRAPTRRWALLQPTASDALRTSVTSM